MIRAELDAQGMNLYQRAKQIGAKPKHIYRMLRSVGSLLHLEALMVERGLIIVPPGYDGDLEIPKNCSFARADSVADAMTPDLSVHP